MKHQASTLVYEKYEEARHIAEVNYVSKQTGAWIKEFLEKVKIKRGDDAYHRLRNDVLKVWNK